MSSKMRYIDFVTTVSKTFALETICNFNSSSDSLPDTFRKTFEESIGKIIDNVTDISI